MSDVRAYHPGLDRVETVPEESMFHLRQSGWLLESEHLDNQAAAAEAAAKPAAKTAKSDEGK